MGKRREYYMGEGGGFPRVRAVMSQMNLCCPWLVLTPKVFPNVNQPTCWLILMQDRVAKYVVPLPSLILELSAHPSHPLQC
jgi:hypothetical protein